jgi:hypothetical protein
MRAERGQWLAPSHFPAASSSIPQRHARTLQTCGGNGRSTGFFSSHQHPLSFPTHPNLTGFTNIRSSLATRRDGQDLSLQGISPPALLPVPRGPSAQPKGSPLRLQARRIANTTNYTVSLRALDQIAPCAMYRRPAYRTAKVSASSLRHVFVWSCERRHSGVCM